LLSNKENFLRQKENITMTILYTKYIRLFTMIGVLLVGSVLFLSACSAGASTSVAPTATRLPTPAAQVGWQQISIQEAAAKRDAGAFILDVREPSEWNQVHIPGATLIPLGELQQRVNEVPKDQEVVVYCHSGNRSKTGADILAKAGYTNISSMNGGIQDWISAGYPTTSGQ
jgi:rhodanese-related sulfurtransferase